MPDLSVHYAKSKHLQGLHNVCNAEFKCFTHLEEDIEHLCELLQLFQPRHNKAKGVSFVIDSQHNAHNEDLSEPLQQHYQQPQPV